MDDAFGRVQTIEKAAEIYLKTCMTGRPYLSAIPEEDILRMSREYGLGIEATGVFNRPAMRPEGHQQMSQPVPAQEAPAPAEVQEVIEATEAAIPASEPVPVPEPVPASEPEPVSLEEPLSAQQLADPPLSAQGFPKLGGPEMTVEAALEATPPAFRSQSQAVPGPQPQVMPEPQPQFQPDPQLSYQPEPQVPYQSEPQAQPELGYQPQPELQAQPGPGYQPQSQEEKPVYRYYPKPSRS